MICHSFTFDLKQNSKVVNHIEQKIVKLQEHTESLEKVASSAQNFQKTSVDKESFS